MRVFLLIFFIVLLGHSSFGQRYSFIRYSTSEGLPQSQVTSMTQDSFGYLWVGTYGGLSRFDGNNFTNFGKRNGLLNNRITHLQILDGLLYIGHPQGISVKDSTNSFISFPFSEELSMYSVTGVFTLDGTLYVTTNGNGLFWLDKYSKTLKPIEDSPHRIRGVIPIKDKVYLATRGGIHIYDGKQFTPVSGSDDYSFSGLFLKENKLFASSYNGIVFLINTEEQSIKPILENENHLFRKIVIDHQNNKWLNSSDGVMRIRKNDTLFLTEESGLPTNDINLVFEDSEHNIWMGTNGKGIIRFTGETFTHYNERSGFPSDLIVAIEIDGRKNKWFSSIDAGVFMKDPSGKVTYIDYIPTVVWQIRHSDDLVLFASDFGLFTYDYKQFRAYYSAEDGLPSDRIVGIHSIDDSTFLISTSAGGILFDKKEKKLYTRECALTSIKSIRKIKYNNDEFYVASSNSIAIIKDEKVEKHPFDSNISSIELDQNNTLWVGTENGLYYYKEGAFELFILGKETDLEFVNFIQQFDTLLFVGTNNGLFELGINKQYRFHYGINSGLVDLETNLNSNYLEDGRYLWFGTASGLMKMDLTRRHNKDDKLPPQLILTDIVINNQPIAYPKTIASNQQKEVPKLIVKYADKNISFLFDGIQLSNPIGLEYNYYLEGFSTDWSPSSKVSNVSFTNLPPGDYIFYYKVTNSLQQSSEVFSLPLKISPPFYQSWWFYLFIGLFVTLLIIFIEKFRSKRLAQANYQNKLELQNRLTKLEQQSLNASMNRHFIFNSLNSIQYYINISDTKSANRYLSRFAKLIRKNLDSSYNEDGMVSLRDELDRLELYLELESMRFAGRFEYIFEVEENIEQDALMVPGMFLQPFVENSIIHGILPLKNKVGKIEIIVTEHLDHIRIKIQDNGIGIDNSIAKKKQGEIEHQSRGMLITKNRIELLQKFSASSISMNGPHQINKNNSSINGTVVIFKILKQYL